jgi:bacterioferritin-associated ferredoxin
MIVCVCHRVSDRQIEREARGGCASFDELQADLRVGTACGACTDCARETFECHRSAHGAQPHAGFAAGHGLRATLTIAAA